MLNNRQV